MSGLKGHVLAVVLSMGFDIDEWHQRTGVVKRAEGLYDLYPGYPDNSKPTQIQFVPRPYKQQNHTTGVTAEALIYTVVHHLEQPGIDSATQEAIKHLNAALDVLHERRIHSSKD